MRSKNLLLRIAGGLAIVVVFFFGTLFALDYMGWGSPDSIRASNAKAIMEALQKYRAAKGAYPLIPATDGPLAELAGPLVGGGFLSAFPADPTGGQKPRYISADGKAYGLWLYFERSGACMVEVGITRSGWWGNPPPCRF
jgi:hypothetical protein